MDKKLVYVLLVILFVGCVSLGIYTFTIEKKVKSLDSDISNTANVTDQIKELEKSVAEKEEVIKEKDKLLSENEQAIKDKDAKIEELNTKVTELTTEVETLKSQIPQPGGEEVPVQ